MKSRKVQRPDKPGNLGNLGFFEHPTVDPRGPSPLHELSPIVYLMGVAQRSIGLEDRIGGAAPWTTSPASVA
jgi:hypothetical protein